MTAKNHLVQNQLANVNPGSRSILKIGGSVSMIAIAIYIAALVTPLAQAQTFQVLHSFTGKIAGTESYAGVTLDRAGNVYGTTIFGGFYNAAQCSGAGCGVAYRLNPSGQETVIYAFQGRQAGGRPIGGLVRDAQGNLYGTASVGGDSNCNPSYGCGIVFKIDSAGHEMVLHSFTGGSDGIDPQSTLVRDAAGNLYGTTLTAGRPGCVYDQGCGVVFKITP
jgi:uncharacterized repeat protein (TIGR03803 family)